MERDCISVCICTFKRPELLSRLLYSLTKQALPERCEVEVVLVDNDGDRSAENVVRKIQLQTTLNINYDCEPEQNISLARNRAIRNARGNLIALIDDDECAGGDWLIQLYQALKRYGADGVLGPVLPDFPPGAPEWLKRGNFFDRMRRTTGSVISERDTRTGNALFRRAVFRAGELWFDPVYGRTGGEDCDFFRRQGRLGRVFVWCDEGVVYETVPPERWSLSFHLKKSLRIGGLTGDLVFRGELPSNWLFTKSLLILVVSLPLVPLTLAVAKHLRARVLMKMAYSVGYLLGRIGIGRLRQTKLVGELLAR